MNSCEKGKRGERAWRNELMAHGYNALRGQQFSGSPDSPDVICPDLPGFHFEVKTVERLNINEAVAQAVNDAADKIPVVAHRRSRGGWLVTMRADDWFRLLAVALPEHEADQRRISHQPGGPGESPVPGVKAG
ncbi:MAG: hypothetical protein ACLQAH_05330 [Limisphaerales bacterium]